MNYKQKIQKVQVKMDILLTMINQISEPPKEMIQEMDVLTKQHYQLLKKYYEKSQYIRLIIVTTFQMIFIAALLVTIVQLLK